jgi:ribosome biogenesis GTPase / thiamine phosphate phosphatase
MDDRLTTLAPLGWDAAWEARLQALGDPGLLPGRVAVEDKHQYVIFAAAGELAAHVPGRLLHEARSPAALPKVGDWVAAERVPNEDKALIRHVLPRRSRLTRKVAGREREEQVLATNVDLAFVVQALDDSFNPRRLERFLVMVNEGGVRPVVLLNKSDLCPDLAARVATATASARDTLIVTASAKTGRGMQELRRLIAPGCTVAFIGSSGVGKSSLINRLYGEEIQPTIEVRASDSKGRHTTSWRELIVLPQGGLVIDTPGMREFHLWTADTGLDEAFPEVVELAVRCHFRGCTHTTEKRCAVTEAVATGGLANDRYLSFLKLKAELDSMAVERRQQSDSARRRRDKAAQRAFNHLKRGNAEDE